MHYFYIKFSFQKCEVDFFAPILPTTIQLKKSLDIMYKTDKILKEDRLPRDSGIQVTTLHWVPWIFFFPHLPRFGAGEVSKPEIPNGHR